MYKVIYKNAIGKILYNASVSGKFSKIRRVPEKQYKNQIKIAVIESIEVKEKGQETKWKNQQQFCLINFKRTDDLEAFEKHF